MSFHYENKKAVNILLFMLQCLGNESEAYRLFVLLYLADIKHLSRAGTIISGDTYFAMKNGPVPLHMVALCRQLREERTQADKYALARLGMLPDGRLNALAAYDSSVLAPAEVDCLFETIHCYKDKPIAQLAELATGHAWMHAEATGEIPVMLMATESGVSADMARYIETAYADEIIAFSTPPNTIHAKPKAQI